MVADKSASEFLQIIATLKQIMKAQKMTYKTLAKRLRVSEATIKRIFTSSDTSFSRIVEICEALSISFMDLVQQAHDGKEQVFCLTTEQESFFASHLNYYAFFQELLHDPNNSYGIQKKYKLSAHSMTKYLKKLEELGLLVRLEKDRVRLLVRGTHNWIDGGPLQQKFLNSDNLKFVEYLNANFKKEMHYMTSSDRSIHQDTFAALLSDLKGLASLYRKRAYRDERYYPKSDLIKVKWLLGAAPFERRLDNLIDNI